MVTTFFFGWDVAPMHTMVKNIHFTQAAPAPLGRWSLGSIRTSCSSSNFTRTPTWNTQGPYHWFSLWGKFRWVRCQLRLVGSLQFHRVWDPSIHMFARLLREGWSVCVTVSVSESSSGKSTANWMVKAKAIRQISLRSILVSSSCFVDFATFLWSDLLQYKNKC